MASETPHGAARAHERAHDAVDAAREARERSVQLRVEGELRRRRRRAARCVGPVDAATAAVLRDRLGRPQAPPSSG